MSERQVVAAGTLIGALAGMAASYLYFTASGQRHREMIEQNLTMLAQEGERLLSVADQVRQSVSELRGKSSGWPRTA